MGKRKGIGRPGVYKRALCTHCRRVAEVKDKTMTIQPHAQRNGSVCPGSDQSVTPGDILSGAVANPALPLKRGRSKGGGPSGQSVRTISGGLPGSRRGH